MEDVQKVYHFTYRKHKNARLAISLLILLIACTGITIFSMHKRSVWFYTQMMTGTIATLSLWLYWYLNRQQCYPNRTTFLHQILHWCGTMISVYALITLVTSGLITSNQASIVAFFLLSLSLFLAGVYTDTIFIILGIILGLLTCSLALYSENILLHNTCITGGGVILIFIITQLQQYTTKKKQQNDS